MGNYERTGTTAERLRFAMDKAGKRQIDIVKETGIDKGALSHYLKGRFEPKQDVVYKLAKFLNVSEMWLWGYDCQMERTTEQQKNDILSDIIIEMRINEDFLSVVETVYNFDSAKRSSVLAFVQYLRNQI